MGSAGELESGLLFSRDLKFLNSPDFQQLEREATELKRTLAALI